jgi:segregation and condensation protein A
LSYRVRIGSFEGPFDLLLYLVSRQRVDIGSISITEIADQYLDEIAHMQEVDLDVASDFLLVATTLLEIKAQSLLPKPEDDALDDVEELAPSEARDLLVERLLVYKQFKNAAAALGLREERQARTHHRAAGPDRSLLTLMPDYLDGVTLDGLAFLCARALGRRDPFLLDSDHIASKPIPVEAHVRGIYGRLRTRKHLTFSELVAADAPAPIVVVTFLAILELYKRGMVTVRQDVPFGDIDVDYIEGAGELVLAGDDALTSVEEA